ncbi:MAG: RDD family protein [Candidatus Nanoarchaeia archaeon]|nr:RDD family protein [Candidatus Nanoarchaeia archaeon]
MKRGKKEVIVKATFFRRVMAYVLDVIIIALVIGLPLGYAYDNVDNGDFKSELINPKLNFKDVIMSTIFGILTVLYWAVFEFKIQQSPGKSFLGMYVVSTNKEKLTFWRAVTRNIVKVSTIFLILDCLYMFFRRTNQRYTEKIANTQVLRLLE